MAFGDIFLEDLRVYRERNLAQLGMEAIFPIWKRDTRELARDFVRLGFAQLRFVSILAFSTPSFAGRVLDESFFADLPPGVDPCGENGEFHTFVFDGPIFREPVRFQIGEKVMRDGFCFCDLFLRDKGMKLKCPPRVLPSATWCSMYLGAPKSHPNEVPTGAMLQIRKVKMNKRKLGNSGLEISPLVFGGNVIGWTADEATTFKLLDAFVAAGFNAIDTADVYSRWAPGHTGGESETILGKWLKRSGNRAKVIVATKVGMEWAQGKGSVEVLHIEIRREAPCSGCRRTTSISTSLTSTTRTRRSRKHWERTPN